MGIEIDRDEFSPEEYDRFEERLERSVAVLADLLVRPGFGEGAPSLGAELEVSLVDAQRLPLPMNQSVLAETLDPRLTVELDRFNLESNLQYGPLAGRPFALLTSECDSALAEMRRAAAVHGGEVAMIGILPTLRDLDLTADAMTETMRYRALSAGLRRLRREPFLIDIHGQEDLHFRCADVGAEGAATSFQVHLRIPPSRFVATFNAVQLATPWALAVSGNSPIFLGRLLWDETRVALFKQAVDHRARRGSGGDPSRVSFGRDWARGTLELFEENVRCHPPLLPVLDNEDPMEMLAAGATPSLRELRLHQGTVWSWNRAIYDPADAGHLRIEMRTLPSGPTVKDMLASTAFHLGLALDLAQDAEEWKREVAFEEVHVDFYLAARAGLDAELAGPRDAPSSRGPMTASIEALLSSAQRGLDAAGVDRRDSEPLLSVIERRVRSGRTGACWQRSALEHFGRRRGRREALARMLSAYLEHSLSGQPVHEWPEVTC